MKKFDAVFIGSGQAGTPLVFSFAAKDKKVAFIERNKVGGTCLNVGCTSTKTYVASARPMWDMANCNALGVDFVGDFKSNMKKIKERKDLLINKSIKGIEDLISNHENITYFNVEAHFLADKIVEVNGEKITAEQIFINIGGRPFVPNKYQDILYLTNPSILELTDLPEHLLIIGGSYIGLQFGQIFKRFGSKVTIIERGDRLISREDFILVNQDTDKIIGACVLGTGGDEIITSILNVMYADKQYSLIRDSIVLHSTISELIPTTLEQLKSINE